MTSLLSQITFPPLEKIPWLKHGFTLCTRTMDMKVDRSAALQKLSRAHADLLGDQGISWERVRFAEQVHENRVALVQEPGTENGMKGLLPELIRGVDGLLTLESDVPLGIYVADCCAVYLVETHRRGIALLHAGRKGAAENMVQSGVQKLLESTGGKADSITAVLSPCIHPCCYDVDFSSQIVGQLKAEGVGNIWQHPDCTGCHPDRYYSYRKEQGKTGRMLAFMMIHVPENP